MKRIAVISVLSIVMSALSSTGQVPAPHDEVLGLLQSIEFKELQRQELERHGVNTVPILTEIVEKNAGPFNRPRAVTLLAGEYLRHEGELEPAQKTRTLTALVRLAKGLEGYELVQAIVGLKGIDSDLIRSFANELQTSSNEDVRNAARALSESVKPHGSSDKSSSPSFPQPQAAQPVAQKKAPATQPTTSPPSEEPTSSTPWAVIAVVVVAAIGLLVLLLKR